MQPEPEHQAAPGPLPLLQHGAAARPRTQRPQREAVALTAGTGEPSSARGRWGYVGCGGFWRLGMLGGATSHSVSRSSRCHHSASPKKPPPSRACTACWAGRPEPAHTCCPSQGMGTGGTGTRPRLALAWRCRAGLTASPCRKAASGPRHSLSVEDIGAPDRLRTVGRVVEVFPDGTSLLEIQRPPHGSFGFQVTSGHGRPDTGTVASEW